MSMAETPAEPSYPKLPFRKTISLAYATFFSHFMDALRASWLWLIVAAVLTAYASWAQWSWIAGALGTLPRGQPPRVGLPLQMWGLLQADHIVMIFAGVSIAVAWHRLMILNERPGISGTNVASVNLWRYILAGFLLCLVALAPLIIIFLGGLYVMVAAKIGTGPGLPMAYVPLLLVVFALYITSIAVMLRLILLLPARAVGNTDLSFGETWQRTRGNAWRLFWGLIATSLPPVLLAEIIVGTSVGLLIPVHAQSGDIAVRLTAVSTVMMVCYLLMLPISIGFLSHAYRHFFERPLGQSEPGAVPA